MAQHEHDTPVDPCDAKRYPPDALVDTVDALNRHDEWFDDEGPHVLVVDGFYADPDRIRATALRQAFVQYLPPLPEQVGDERAAEYAFPPAWFASALWRHRGADVRHPVHGFRYAPDDVRDHLANITGERVRTEHWDDMGDGWNGAFHVQNQHWRGEHGSIHHHHKSGDVTPRGWSGLVYLTPNAPPSAGTSIWRDRRTGRCIGAEGIAFHRTPGVPEFELALLVENRYNRLVLFRENVLHRAEHGFGDAPHDARLTQTFFFCTDPI